MLQLRRFPLFLSLCVLALLLSAGPAIQTAEAVDFKSAWADLDELKKSAKSRATNEDALGYLDAVFTDYQKLDKPKDPGKDATDEEKKAFSDAMAKFKKEEAKFRKAAEKQILKMMTLVKVKANTNIRDDVNIAAAKILGSMASFLDAKGRKDLSKKIQGAIEKRLTKVKTHDVNTELLAAAFGALGALNDKGSLQWLLKNYTHANEVKKDYIIAAHKAMVLFKGDAKPGKLRQEICQEFVKVYAGVESQAEQSTNDPKVLAKKRFWDDIKTSTIPVVQYFSKDHEGNPAADAEGVPIATMVEFQAWLRTKRSLKKKPWVDAI